MGFPLKSEMAVICSLLRSEKTDSVLDPTISNFQDFVLPITYLSFILQVPSALYSGSKETFSGLALASKHKQTKCPKLATILLINKQPTSLTISGWSFLPSTFCPAVPIFYLPTSLLVPCNLAFIMSVLLKLRA